MHPLLIELSRKFDRLKSRGEILEAVSDLEDVYDALSGIEQESTDGLIEELNRRLRSAAP